jgi:cyclic pyranopterin phosphate synthase
MAAKRTADLIPLCHPLPLTSIKVEVSETGGGLKVLATVKTTAPTGVEMEALTAASIALLTLYDMLKAADKAMTIEGVRVVQKSGGRSGDFTAGDYQADA